ncbi:MAG: bifunctional enoyl-CoA hydratase/phosphate acetyltransferase [Burkholderiaceae bacterium]
MSQDQSAAASRRSNRLFDEIVPGDTAVSRRVCTEHSLYLFAQASRNINPLHIPNREARIDADGDPLTGASASALWIGALVSELVGSRLPGPGAILRAQSLVYHQRIFAGTVVQTRIKVIEKRAPDLVVLEARASDEAGALVASGQLEVFTPPHRIEFEDEPMPEVIIDHHPHFERIVAACAGVAPTRVAVICPEDVASLEGALAAAGEGLIEPVLVGRRDLMEAAAAELGADIGGFELVEAGEHHAAAAQAVALAAAGRVGALMKGHLHTDELLGAVLARDGGLRTGRRLSHVFVLDVPGRDRPLFITDAAININPDLAAKADIVRNAIGLAHACGIAEPRIGILSAIETVNPAIPSTIDAAVLSKMAERGQITGGLVDGPLAMDNAVDVDAARTKGITSLVAGRADVLVAPNMEAGNMIAKELSFVAQAESAGLAIGAAVPVILTSRSDNAYGRLVSCALAKLVAHWQRTGTSLMAPGADTAEQR